MSSRYLRSLAWLLVAVALVAVPGTDASAQKKGGVIRVAVLGDPPTLDSHWTTANFVEVITQHMYEGLYTLDQSYQPIPDLADGMPAVSADGLVYTIKLRQGIKFHNGKEMTSEDVVASLKRWGGYAAQAKALWASVEDVRPIREVRGRAPAQGEGGHRPDRAGQRQQLRRDLPEGDRREVPDAEQGDRVHRDRPLQVRRVEAGQPHPHGPLRRLQAALGGAQRLGRAEGRLPGRDPLDPDAGRGDPGRRAGVGRGGLRRRPPGRRVRPDQGEPEAQAPGRPAVHLGDRRLQQEGRPDDQPEAPPGHPGGDRRRAGDEGRGREPALLPAGLRALLPGAEGLALDGRGALRTTSTTRTRPSSSSRRPATRASRSGSSPPRSTPGCTTTPWSPSSSSRSWGW